MLLFQTADGVASRAEELDLVRDDDDFISRVIAYLPADMKQGYVSDDSEESDAGKRPCFRRGGAD